MTQSQSGNERARILVHVDPELLDLIPEFMENRRADVIELIEALESGHYDLVRRLGHNLKGSGGAYGFDCLTNLGEAIEDAALQADVAMIRSSIAKLADYLARVEVLEG